jgi:hypothetical protein
MSTRFVPALCIAIAMYWCAAGMSAAWAGGDVEDNVDRPGGDYSNFDVAKPAPGTVGGPVDLCRMACEGDLRCKAWTFVREGVQGPSPRCWLKTAIPAARASQCCISGVPRRSIEANVDRPGGDYRHFDLAAADPNLCRQACDQEGECQAWTLVNPGVQGPSAKCWLKRSVPDARSSGCCTSGVKAFAAPVAVASAPSTPAAVPAQPPAAPAAAQPLGRRAALVIENSEYAAVGRLANPKRDAETIAAALKADGFEVTTADNLGRSDFIAAMNKLSDTAAKADWAVIYFAGHGLQVDGVNYLVPVDAKLAEDRDVRDEAIPLDRAIETVSGARKLGLVIVDACRNNPFLTNMHFTTTARATRTRGLARVDLHGTTLVEFSAREGQEALDGDPAGNSPFAAALAKRLAEPGLEVNMLLRQVRVDVLAATSNRQEPMFSGDLPAEAVFFRPQ